MKIYAVGGQVRDQLLGLPIKDRDFVVVGSTPEEMIANGFTQVGADFPVFLHPKTGEEYALARTERKTAPGYNGFTTNFASNVLLSEDLMRRDLTINSMAQDLETGEIIDLFGGQDDLKNGVLRHTSKAFAEDPIRVLRIARFAARYNFTVNWSTLQLMKTIVHELDFVTKERIWTELEKGLSEDNPHRMISVLDTVGAFNTTAMSPYKFTRANAVRIISESTTDIFMRFAVMTGAFEDEDYKTHRIPIECSIIGKAYNKYRKIISNDERLSPEQILTILEETRAFSSVVLLTKVCQIIKVVDGGFFNISSLTNAVQACATVDTTTIALQHKEGPIIKEKIKEARLNAIKDKEKQ